MSDLLFSQPPSGTGLTFGDTSTDAPATDLVFSQAPGGTALVFGSGAGVEPTIPKVTAQVVVAVPTTLVVQVLAAPTALVHAQVVLGSTLTVQCSGVYDHLVKRFPEVLLRAPIQKAVEVKSTVDAPWERPHGSDTEMRAVNRAASALVAEAQAVQTIAQSTEAAPRVVHTLADAIAAHGKFSAQSGVRLYSDPTARYQSASKEQAHGVSPVQAGIAIEGSCTNRVQIAIVHLFGVTGSAKVGDAFIKGAGGQWQVCGQIKVGKEAWPPPKPEIPQPQSPSTELLFECPPLLTGALLFRVGSPCGGDTVVGGTIVVPIRRVYMVLNSASLRRVDGNIYLPTFSMTLSLDMASWTWGFSASLPGSALANLSPDTFGAPVEVEAMVNGVPYRALVESIGRNRSFGRDDIQVQGRGKTALLDAPYAPSLTFRNTEARTAMQIANDILTANGVSIGWDVNFQLTDWLVPAGVFNHTGSYIAALNAVASAAGGYVQPSTVAQALSILPKYPHAPWNWGTVAPDYELPADLTTQESINWFNKAAYNRVYVSGVHDGVLGQVTRQGTAGDVLAPMVTDALITTASAARQRGVAILGDTGRMATVTLKLPVLPATGVITPGKYVRYVDGAATRMGLVRSVNVEVGMPEIWQSIGVETHVA